MYHAKLKIVDWNKCIGPFRIYKTCLPRVCMEKDRSDQSYIILEINTIQDCGGGVGRGIDYETLLTKNQLEKYPEIS